MKKNQLKNKRIIYIYILQIKFDYIATNSKILNIIKKKVVIDENISCNRVKLKI